MTEKKSKLWLFVIALAILFGFVMGIVTHGLISPVKEIEISPRSGENVLQFYVDYLKAHGYNVTIQELHVNDYREVEDFKEFLWVLQSGNFSECYVDYGEVEQGFLFGKRTLHIPKLWVQFDGVYWELRMND